MNGYSYHPEQKEQSEYYITDKNQLESMVKFIKTIEEQASFVITDLVNIVPSYKEARELADKLNVKEETTQNFIPQWWPCLKDYKEKEFVFLKEKLISWARKYHLCGSKHSEMFLHIATTAIMDFYEATVVENKNDYKLSLSYVLDFCFIDEVNMIAKQKGLKGIEANHTIHSTYPFVFSPAYWETHSSVRDLDRNFNYLLRIDEARRVALLEGKGSFNNNFLLTEKFIGYGWDPRSMSWGDFERELDSMYTLAKKKYKEHCANDFERMGFEKGKVKRNHEHFSWLVDYQIAGKSIKNIADSNYVSSDSVRDGINSLAQIIGLKLRVDKGGRPKKI